MFVPRRRFLQLAAGAAALPAFASASLAQTYPSRPLNLVVFVPAGGAPDIVARVVAPALAQRLGQPVVIENRPGGGGNLALQQVARAPADGHTLLLVATPHAVNVTLYQQQSVTVLDDIAPVASINDDSFAMVVPLTSPAKTVAEFVAHAKANPGKLNMGSSGTGNLSHLAGELFKMMTGIDVVHVPYRGMPAANTAMMTGEAHVLFNALASIMPLIREGRVRPLAVTAAKRVKFLPDVPAVAETVPGYAVTGSLGIGVPKGTPSEIIDKLNKEVNATLADPEVLQKLDNLGSEPFTGTPADFGRFMAAETAKWAKVVRYANLKVE
jgi:tripartite-type tricarboxylate transporter receptor subunit TctC